MIPRVYVPGDSAARSVGADAVARAIREESAARHLDLRIIRTGSRGLYFLEPMVEVGTSLGRVAYGPVSSGDVPSLFASDFLSAGDHPLRLGQPSEIDYLHKQERRVFARAGIVDPTSLDDYLLHGGYHALHLALERGGEATVAEITTSELRGRGGAGFPAGIKWRTVLETGAGEKFVVCNADEGDSGSFSDRLLMESDPFALLEGMTIAAVTVGAKRGFIYIRSEYPDAFNMLSGAIVTARDAHYLGPRIAGSDHDFEIELRRGAGSYVCGEETAMLESIEGRRGEVRARPPVPAISGLFGRPTLVNNVITFATIPVILGEGATTFRRAGFARSRGTLPIQLSGNTMRPGLIEVPFGVTIREVVEEYGGGSGSGRPVRAVQVGGSIGAFFPRSLFDTPIDYEAIEGAGGILGHGGIVVFHDRINLARVARNAMQFAAEESCGKCTPCRIGTVRAIEIIDSLFAGDRPAADVSALEDLAATMKFGSLCALGGLAPLPILSVLRYFPEDFGRPAIVAERAQVDAQRF